MLAGGCLLLLVVAFVVAGCLAEAVVMAVVAVEALVPVVVVVAGHNCGSGGRGTLRRSESDRVRVRPGNNSGGRGCDGGSHGCCSCSSGSMLVYWM